MFQADQFVLLAQRNVVSHPILLKHPERVVLCSADDPQLAEFLQLMQPRRAGTIWSNDDVTLAQPAVKGGTAQSAAMQLSAHKVSMLPRLWQPKLLMHMLVCIACQFASLVERLSGMWTDIGIQMIGRHVDVHLLAWPTTDHRI